MQTTDTAKMTKTKYFVEYSVINNTQDSFLAYYVLVRSCDAALLYASDDLDNIWLHCFHAGINKNDITLW